MRLPGIHWLMPKQLLNLLCLVCLMAPTASGLAAQDKPIVIGAVYNLHGFQANLDIPSSEGARLAVEQANRDGGLLGRTVELAVADGLSKPRVIARKTAALLKRYKDMPGLLGLSDTDMVLAAAPVAARSRRLFLTSGATSPRLPQQVPDYLYLACFGDNVQAAAAAETAWYELDARTVAVLYAVENTYTDLLQGYFRARFTGLGGTVSPVRAYTPGRLDDIAAGLGSVDLVFLATGSADEAAEIIQRLRAAGVTAPVFGGDSYDSEELWQRHPALQDVYYTTHAYLGEDNPDPVVQGFRQAFLAAYGSQPDAFAALGYDAARLLMSAIRQAGSTDPEAVLQALGDIHEFTGVTGTLRYPQGGHIPVKSVTVLQTGDGATALFRVLVPGQVPAP
jgi:branched-chain amino acid transport system substrate-binding protein